ncbi:MAG: hypothetical protein AB8F94_05325 [Saprospiraceae bacterium]
MKQLESLIKQMASNPKVIFLIDGFGALLSVFLLGVVLVRLESLIGMPQQTLFFLAGIAVFFTIYSFFCAFRIKKNWRVFLKIIASFNLSYCILTFSLLLFHQDHITNIGNVYFLLEILTIASLALFEFKVARTKIDLN